MAERSQAIGALWLHQKAEEIGEKTGYFTGSL
jgi:hypothetical protein